jgi:hypothetical protein
MRIAKWVLLVFASAAAAQTVPPAADSIEAHLAAGKMPPAAGTAHRISTPWSWQSVSLR